MGIKIWHISDTHSYHSLLTIPEGIDMVIHSGDCSNWRDPYKNKQEVLDFIAWYGSLPIKHKIFVAGNHDSSVEARHVDESDFGKANIVYLENESTTIEGLNIWGSPYTPTFGNWCFMRKREKLHNLWQTIPENTDIVITHGPPKGILDLSYNRQNELEFCGCNALRKAMFSIKPKLCLFGHIHNCEDIINAGIKKLSVYENTTFSNGSVVTDGKFGKLTSNGNIFIL